MSARTPTLDFNADRVADDLKERRQWLNWRLEWRKNKSTKVPTSPHTGGAASSTDPSTWGTYEEAMARTEADGLGVGFVLNGDMTGFDLDKCRNPETGEIAPWAQAIIDALDSYTEISPSGTGIHIITKGTLPPGARRCGNIEMYDTGRFLTVTGNHLDGTPTTVEERQDVINRLHVETFPPRNEEQRAQLNGHTPLDLSDAEIIARAETAANGPKFSALWRGDTSGYGSASEADLALCSLLRFWVGADPDRIDRLFRQSGLHRDKWERQDYRERTIAVAIENGEQYHGGKPRRAKAAAHHADDVDDAGTTPASPRKLTDLGNAERLRDQYGDRIRYCRTLDTWFIWTGVRWEADATGQIYRFAEATVRAIYAEAAGGATVEERDAIAKHATRSEGAARIEAMISLARSLEGIPVVPAQLDADRWVLNCLNGTLDLRTGALRDHDPADLITKLAPVVYAADATHPLWDKFIKETTGGDDAFAGFLMRAAGSTLSGDPIEEVMFMPHGPGATGKSTLLDGLKATLGDYAMTADFEAFLKKRGDGGIRNDIARLAGARFVVSVEVDEGKRLAEGLVKMLTGGDTVTARHLYREAFEFRPAFTLWLAANHAPKVNEDDDAMWRRIIRLPFTNVVPKGKRDPKIKATLRDPAIAGPAILAWAVRGCLEWQKDGLGVPAVVEQATDAYRREMDPIADFVDASCVLSPQAWTPTDRLWGALTVYMEEASDEPYPATKKALAERLRRLGCAAESRRQQGKLARGWRGIALKEDDTPGGEALPIEDERNGCNGCNANVGNFPHKSLHEEKLHTEALQPLHAYTGSSAEEIRPSPVLFKATGRNKQEEV